MHIQIRTSEIKMSGSELQPRKVKLIIMYNKKYDNYSEYFTHNNGAYKQSYKATLLQ